MMSMEHARWRHLRPEGPLTELRLVRLSSALRRYLAQTNSKKNIYRSKIVIPARLLPAHGDYPTSQQFS